MAGVGKWPVDAAHPAVLLFSPNSSEEQSTAHMAEELFLISDVTKRLNVPPHRVAYLFLTRKLPEPKLRLGNRRVFTVGEARRVAKALGRPWDMDDVKEAGE
jgi:hypothetical protein